MINTLHLKHKAPTVYADLVEAVGVGNELDIIDMDVFTALDRFLSYNGIQGYTRDIIDTVDALRACEVKR